MTSLVIAVERAAEQRLPYPWVPTPTKFRFGEDKSASLVTPHLSDTSFPPCLHAAAPS